MKVVSLQDVKAASVIVEGASGVTRQVPLGKADGVPNFSFRVFSVEPGGHTPYHSHESEHLNYVIEGGATLVDADGNHHPVGCGEFALVKPHEKHQYRNLSETQVLRMICAVPALFE